MVFSFNNRLPLVQNARTMSLYHHSFKDPVYNKEEQEKMKADGTFDKLAAQPIKAAKTTVTSSAMYDPLLEKFTNYFMMGGRKDLAERLVSNGLEKIKRHQMQRYHLAKTDEQRNNVELNSRIILHRAIENCRPMMMCQSIKRGGTNYRVPVPLNEKQSYMKSMQWLREAIRTKLLDVHLPESFSWEILDAAYGRGRVVARKKETHKECEANRAYAHYRWLSGK